MKHRLVVSYWRFRTTYRSHIQVWPLKIGPTGCLEKLLINYPSKPRLTSGFCKSMEHLGKLCDAIRSEATLSFRSITQSPLFLAFTSQTSTSKQWMQRTFTWRYYIFDLVVGFCFNPTVDDLPGPLTICKIQFLSSSQEWFLCYCLVFWQNFIPTLTENFICQLQCHILRALWIQTGILPLYIIWYNKITIWRQIPETCNCL